MNDPFDDDRSPRVLIVEDEPRLREMLLHALPDMGFTGTGAKSGEEGLRVMEKDTHQVIVLDLNLPGMHGLEFFKTVREKWPATQVVILTGFGDLETARQAIHLDVADFLTKPCPLGDLEASLERARKRIKEAALPGASTIKPALLRPPIDLDAAEAPALPPEEVARSTQTLADIERKHILEVLRKHGGNRNATADELGISVRTLYYRLSEYQKEGYEV